MVLLLTNSRQVTGKQVATERGSGRSSSLPEDSSIFYRNGGPWMLRYHSHRVVGRCTSGRHGYAIAIASGSRFDASHFLPHRTVSVDSVGIEFHSDGIRVEAVKIDVNFKHLLLPSGLGLHLAKA